MRKGRFYRRRYDILTGFVLVMLLFRAYVPVGFMPASGAPFLLALCPAASPAMHGHHHPGNHTQHVDTCPFGSAPAAGPIAQVLAWQQPAPIATATAAAIDAPRIGARRERAHQPRGPPSPV